MGKGIPTQAQGESKAGCGFPGIPGPKRSTPAQVIRFCLLLQLLELESIPEQEVSKIIAGVVPIKGIGALYRPEEILLLIKVHPDTAKRECMCAARHAEIVLNRPRLKFIHPGPGSKIVIHSSLL